MQNAAAEPAKLSRLEQLQQTYAALERVRALNPDGLLVAVEIVDAARDPQSVLHPHFTWDDKIAAEEWRIEEARRLIRTCYVEIRSEKVPAYVSILPDRQRPEGGYRQTTEISNPELIAEIERTARKELDAWEKRYAHLINTAAILRARIEPSKAA